MKIVIPKKVKIGGHWFTVEHRKDRTKQDGNTALGTSDWRYNKIWLDDAQAEQEKESTFLHEILHMISDLNGLGLDEKATRVLETSLYQVICDNKLFE